MFLSPRLPYASLSPELASDPTLGYGRRGVERLPKDGYVLRSRTAKDRSYRSGAFLNWLVTGGCGFIGTALIRSLLEEGGHRVRVVDNLVVGAREDLASVCEFQEGPGDGPVTLG